MDKFDEILDSGDEAAIEAALAEANIDDVLLDDLGAGGDEPQATVTVEQAKPEQETQDAEQANTETDVKETTESSTEGEVSEADYIEKDGKHYVLADGVASKNGEHKLPYEVLERTRQEKQQLAQEREQLAQEKADLEARASEYERTSKLYKQQLEEANLDPKLLPEKMLQDPEFVNRLKADYPDAGDAIAVLKSEIEQLKQSQTQAQPSQTQQSETPTDVQVAFDQSSHLKGWMESDPQRWQQAQQIDDLLANDPVFASKSVSERFAEVEKRTMLMFGDELPQAAPQQPAAKAPQKPAADLPNTAIPNSPTDLGLSGSDTNKYAHILEQDAGSLTEKMGEMSGAAIEAILEDSVDFL